MKSQRDKRNYIIIGLCMILAIMGVGYAAFSQLLTINGTANITNSWNIEITNIRGVNLSSVQNNGAYDKEEPKVGQNKVSATFHTGLIQPGDTRIYEVEVTNKGSVDADITSVFNNTLSDAIYFSYDGVGPLGGTGTDVLTSSGVYNTDQLTTEEPFSLPANTNNVRYIYITVKYRESVTTQPTNLEATINLELNAEQAPSGREEVDYGLETITAAGKEFTVAKSGDGLYYDSNTGEYYYRGANPDNYIEFSGDVWRIMSISPQGNLKIIKDERIDLTGYSGVNPNDNYKGRFDASGNSGRRTSGYCLNRYAQLQGCNAWAAISSFANTGTGVGYSSGAVIEDSELNTYLNSSYKNSLSDLTYVQTGITWNVGHAGAYNDTKSVPELENMEKAYIWNGDIALATKSEYIRAHGNSECSNAKYLFDNYQNDTCKITNYLYKPDYWYWLLSPYSTRNDYELYAYSGRVYFTYASYKDGSVRPALNLKSNITLTGSGTNDENIYRIVS
ncbi:MAG: hypothetical protein IKE90_02425 [Bacilli bacterium]|nr:hypothetical protein [Bacilli bacterium]